jgi:hypothetical protein
MQSFRHQNQMECIAMPESCRSLRHLIGGQQRFGYERFQLFFSPRTQSKDSLFLGTLCGFARDTSIRLRLRRAWDFEIQANLMSSEQL